MKIIGILIAGMLLLCEPVLAQDHRNSAGAANEGNVHFAWADVLRVDPVYEEAEGQAAAETPQQECYDEQVPLSSSNDNRGPTAVIGAIIGGVIGHTFGRGNGRTAATAVGAVAGAAVGSNVAQKPDPGYRIERHCRPLSRASKPQRRISAYDVEYRYRGEIYMGRLAYDPGDRMRVRVSVVPAE